MMLFLCIFLLSGCFGPKQLDDLAYVIAIGIDKGEEKDLKITFQIAIPVNISGEGSSPGKDTSTLLTVEADSLYGAVSDANTRVSKEINLSQNKMVVFSEELAKEGLAGYINPFVTNREIRPSTAIVISKSKAKDFISTITPVLETDPARYLDLILSSYTYSGYSVGAELVDFYWNTQSKYAEPIAILADVEQTENSSPSTQKDEKEESSSSEETKVTDDPTPNFLGIAVFSGSTMVGELKQDEVVAHSILCNSLSPVNFEVSDIKDSHKTTTVTLSQRDKPKIKVTVENDTPHIEISARIHAQLVTGGSPVDYFNEQNRYQLAKKIENKLTKIINDYLDKTSKEYKSDIVGFGKFLRTQYWTIEELEKVDWLNIYENSEFHVTVEVDLDTSQIVSFTEKEQTRDEIKEKEKEEEKR